MHVLFLVSSMQGGGAERVAALLSNAWAARGMRVTLMPTFSGRGTCLYTLDDRVQLDFLADHVRGRRGRLSRLWALRRHIRRSRPDVIVSFLTDVNVAAILAAFATDVPVVVSERAWPPACRPVAPVRLLRWWLYRRAAGVVVQTTDTRDWIAAACPGARPVVIPNPVEHPMRRGVPCVLPERVVGPQRKVVLAVGRFAREKRMDRVIAAFERVAARHPQWDLVILGEGEERAALTAQVSRAGLAGRVHMPGFVGNTGDWYGRADLHALTSEFEGFPNALLEAMAHGLPAIAFDIRSGPRDLTEGGRSGLLLPDADHVAGLAEAFDALMGDPARRRAIGARAACVRERFGPDRILARWDEVFATVRAARPPSHGDR